jgi:hypothetical protein
MAFAGFANAEKVQTSKKSAKPEAAKVEIEGLEEVAALDAVIKALTAIHATKVAEVKTVVVERQAAEGLRLTKKPDNFRGFEGEAEGSCELRARAVTSPLKPEELLLLKEHGISTTEVVDTVDTYVINPAYMTNMKVMAAVEEALKNAKGIPADLFQKQDGKSKTVVAATAFDELLDGKKKRTVADVEALMVVIGTPALKTTYPEASLSKAFDLAKKLLGAKEEA